MKKKQSRPVHYFIAIIAVVAGVLFDQWTTLLVLTQRRCFWDAAGQTVFLYFLCRSYCVFFHIFLQDSSDDETFFATSYLCGIYISRGVR